MDEETVDELPAYDAEEVDPTKPPLGPIKTALRVLGILAILGGLVVVGVMAYEHWWTARETKAAQTDLSSEFEARRQAFAEGRTYEAAEVIDEVELTEADTGDDPTFAATDLPTTTIPPITFAPDVTYGTLPNGDPAPPPILVSEEAPPKGTAVARILIPKIDVDWTVIEGADLRYLREGPGHFTGTPLPGQLGNAVISGHRTTYGAPFHNLDQLEPGDQITVETLIGTHTFEVVDSIVVSPYDGWVLGNTGSAILTLTTCHPKYSSRQRLIVRSELVAGPNHAVAHSLFPYVVLPSG